jgi:ArsR family transcriptional regulator
MPRIPNSTLARRVAVLKALSHPSRLLITQTLMKGERCVQRLQALVGDDVSTVSKHLSILRSAGVLISEKRGQNVYYSLACDCFGNFLECVDKVCPPPLLRSRRKASCCTPATQ